VQHSNTSIESLRERILRELAALRDMLDKTMRRGTYRERCIVVVSEDRFY
jgi:hypothetical protein